MIDSFAAKLGEITPLAYQDSQALGSLTRGLVRHYKPRTDIVREGDEPRCVRIIVSGWATRYKYLPDGRRQIIALLLPGDVCDHNSSLTDDEMDHSLGTLDGVSLREIDPATFTALSCSDGLIGSALRREACIEVAIQREWTRSIGRRDARERLAHLFCELWHRLNAIGLVAAGAYDLPLNQLDLADVLGLTPVHINRTLRGLRNDGLVVLMHRRLAIPDLRALEAVALFDPSYLHRRKPA